MTEEVAYRYFLQKGSKFLTVEDKFAAPGFGRKEAQSFPTERAALDKAASLMVDLKWVSVVRSRVR
jgi:hypothetical protein